VRYMRELRDTGPAAAVRERLVHDLTARVLRDA
jgi:hypothetical protein